VSTSRRRRQDVGRSVPSVRRRVVVDLASAPPDDRRPPPSNRRQRPRPKPGASPFVQGRRARARLSTPPRPADTLATRCEPRRRGAPSSESNSFVHGPVKRSERAQILGVIRRTHQIAASLLSGSVSLKTRRHRHPCTCLPCPRY